MARPRSLLLAVGPPVVLAAIATASCEAIVGIEDRRVGVETRPDAGDDAGNDADADAAEPDTACSDGTREGLFGNGNVALCAGSWEGDVGGPKAGALCGFPEWVVCRAPDDLAKLRTVVYAEAVETPGCFVYDGAHDFDTCQDCTGAPGARELAGIGHGCDKFFTGHPSCIAGGRIDAVGSLGTDCGWRPSYSGVACCRVDAVDAGPSGFDAGPLFELCDGGLATGCAGGARAGLCDFPNLAACPGTWEGHVSTAQLCASGWHVCAPGDPALHQEVTFDDAMATRGCFAFAAAQDSACVACDPANPEANDLGGIGMFCAYGIRDDPSSCIAGGRVDVAPPDGLSFDRCGYRPGITTGVVCCRDP